MATTPSAQYSLTLRVEIDHRPGMLGKVASAIGDAGGTIGAVDLVQVDGQLTIRDITVETSHAADWPRLTDAVNAVPGAHVLDTTDLSARSTWCRSMDSSRSATSPSRRVTPPTGHD